MSLPKAVVVSLRLFYLFAYCANSNCCLVSTVGDATLSPPKNAPTPIYVVVLVAVITTACSQVSGFRRELRILEVNILYSCQFLQWIYFKPTRNLVYSTECYNCRYVRIFVLDALKIKLNSDTGISFIDKCGENMIFKFSKHTGCPGGPCGACNPLVLVHQRICHHSTWNLKLSCTLET